jgi:hypothetical protein
MRRLLRPDADRTPIDLPLPPLAARGTALSLAHALSAPLMRVPVRTVLVPRSSDPGPHDVRARGVRSRESPTQNPYDRCVAAAPARTALGEEACAAAFSTSQALRVEEAVTEALGDDESAGALKEEGMVQFQQLADTSQ